MDDARQAISTCGGS